MPDEKCYSDIGELRGLARMLDARLTEIRGDLKDHREHVDHRIEDLRREVLGICNEFMGQLRAGHDRVTVLEQWKRETKDLPARVEAIEKTIAEVKRYAVILGTMAAAGFWFLKDVVYPLAKEYFMSGKH